jgi:hypothetical protein
VTSTGNGEVSGSGGGERPTPSDLMWERAANELAPEKTLQRVTDNARFVVTTVGVVGVLLGALGLVTASVLQGEWWLLAAGFATSALAGIAVCIALFTLVARNKKVAPANLTEVEQWFTAEIERKRGAAAASGALFAAAVVALATTVAAGVVAVDSARSPAIDAELSLTATANHDGNWTAHLVGQITGLNDDATIVIRVTAQRRNVINLSAVTDASGTIDIDAEAAVDSTAGMQAVVTTAEDGHVIAQLELSPR